VAALGCSVQRSPNSAEDAIPGWIRNSEIASSTPPSYDAFPRADHQPLGRITVSIGIASYPEDATEATHLINRADQALYEAKDTGGNRVVSWPLESVTAG